jgi:hypothetical protein
MWCVSMVAGSRHHECVITRTRDSRYVSLELSQRTSCVA